MALSMNPLRHFTVLLQNRCYCTAHAIKKKKKRKRDVLLEKSPGQQQQQQHRESFGQVKLDRRVSKRPVLAVIALRAARQRSFPLITKCTLGLSAVLQVSAVCPAIVLHGHVFIIQSQLLANGN